MKAHRIKTQVEHQSVTDAKSELEIINEELRVSKEKLDYKYSNVKALDDESFRLSNQIEDRKDSIKELEKNVGEKEQVISNLELQIKQKEKVVMRLETDVEELASKAAKKADEILMDAEKKVEIESKKLNKIEKAQAKAKENTEKERMELKNVSKHVETVHGHLLSKKEEVSLEEEKLAKKKGEVKEFSDLHSRTFLDIEKKQKRLEKLNKSLEEETESHEQLKKDYKQLKEDFVTEENKLKEVTNNILGLIKREDRVNKLVPEIEEMCKKLGFNLKF